MPSLRAISTIALVAAMLAASSAFAQEGALPLPDPSYGGGPTALQAPTALAMPAPDDMSNPNSVTIPIPGGGEIHVDGPDAPSAAPLPTLPGSQWGNEKQNPFLRGTGPLGP
ncbi:MAG: hypothetical protein Q7S58_04700 [Candidatus Binatus sp.]|uniref:hypothetical protein n=1 Tax=Candidatus Binatus sp. TaxID=2811406 RepID=UPI00271FE62D|nr:hypothetical protein [Candidatus Binatus sp.]MDO8431693.1 hypothetical protein [Candidatus Binatus sp.]